MPAGRHPAHCHRPSRILGVTISPRERAHADSNARRAQSARDASTDARTCAPMQAADERLVAFEACVLWRCAPRCLNTSRPAHAPLLEACLLWRAFVSDATMATAAARSVAPRRGCAFQVVGGRAAVDQRQARATGSQIEDRLLESPPRSDAAVRVGCARRRRRQDALDQGCERRRRRGCAVRSARRSILRQKQQPWEQRGPQRRTRTCRAWARSWRGGGEEHATRDERPARERCSSAGGGLVGRGTSGSGTSGSGSGRGGTAGLVCPTAAARTAGEAFEPWCARAPL
jgi:hypothetical protein